jgi:hypothetical protein
METLRQDSLALLQEDSVAELVAEWTDLNRFHQLVKYSGLLDLSKYSTDKLTDLIHRVRLTDDLTVYRNVRVRKFWTPGMTWIFPGVFSVTSDRGVAEKYGTVISIRLFKGDHVFWINPPSSSSSIIEPELILAPGILTSQGELQFIYQETIKL